MFAKLSYHLNGAGFYKKSFFMVHFKNGTDSLFASQW